MSKFLQSGEPNDFLSGQIIWAFLGAFLVGFIDKWWSIPVYLILFITFDVLYNVVIVRGDD